MTNDNTDSEVANITKNIDKSRLLRPSSRNSRNSRNSRSSNVISPIEELKTEERKDITDKILASKDETEKKLIEELEEHNKKVKNYPNVPLNETAAIGWVNARNTASKGNKKKSKKRRNKKSKKRRNKKSKKPRKTRKR